MKYIYKYRLELKDGVQDLGLPSGAKVLHVDQQAGIPTLWAMVEPTASEVSRRFRVIGTGWPVVKSDSLQHIGTWLCGEYVWHVFEVSP